jgi:hypothetical protein
VSEVLATMGINTRFGDQVLTQRTPSGGLHLYIFFDNPYMIDLYVQMFNSAGLRHTPGQIEFFPSMTRGLRLPFGLIPDEPHDHRAWIQFIDDFRNRRIRRYSVLELYENRSEALSSARERLSTQEMDPESGTHCPPARPRIAGMPKAQRLRMIGARTLTSPTGGPVDRYLELTEKGPRSIQEAEELLSLGIRVVGTRTAALKHLAAHLIWCRDMSAQEAAASLSRWALDPRHESKDVRADLIRGTDKVASHIAELCNWYADHKRSAERTPELGSVPRQFSPVELRALRTAVQALPPGQREDQANFLLHFLAFARQHGKPSVGGLGWEAAPAVRQVIRRWPGCNRMLYKSRIDHAITHGAMVLVKEKWQRVGGKGRARTYRICVPVVDPRGWDMHYGPCAT